MKGLVALSLLLFALGCAGEWDRAIITSDRYEGNLLACEDKYYPVQVGDRASSLYVEVYATSETVNATSPSITLSRAMLADNGEVSSDYRIDCIYVYPLMSYQCMLLALFPPPGMWYLFFNGVEPEPNCYVSDEDFPEPSYDIYLSIQVATCAQDWAGSDCSTWSPQLAATQPSELPVQQDPTIPVAISTEYVHRYEMEGFLHRELDPMLCFVVAVPELSTTLAGEVSLAPRDSNSTVGTTWLTFRPENIGSQATPATTLSNATSSEPGELVLHNVEVSHPVAGNWYFCIYSCYDRCTTDSMLANVKDITVSLRVGTCAWSGEFGSWSAGNNTSAFAGENCTTPVYHLSRSTSGTFRSDFYADAVVPVYPLPHSLSTPARVILQASLEAADVGGSIELAHLGEPQPGAPEEYQVLLRYGGIPTDESYDARSNCSSDVVGALHELGHLRPFVQPNLRLFYLIRVCEGQDDTVSNVGDVKNQNVSLSVFPLVKLRPCLGCPSEKACVLYASTSVLHARCVCPYGRYGENCEYGDVEETASPWPEVFLLCVSNYVILPAVHWTWVRSLYLDGFLYLATPIVSTVYHICDENAGCLFGFYTLKTIDYYFSVVSTLVTVSICIGWPAWKIAFMSILGVVSVVGLGEDIEDNLIFGIMSVLIFVCCLLWALWSYHLQRVAQKMGSHHLVSVTGAHPSASFGPTPSLSVPMPSSQLGDCPLPGSRSSASSSASLNDSSPEDARKALKSTSSSSEQPYSDAQPLPWSFRNVVGFLSHDVHLIWVGIAVTFFVVAFTCQTVANSTDAPYYVFHSLWHVFVMGAALAFLHAVRTRAPARYSEASKWEHP